MANPAKTIADRLHERFGTDPEIVRNMIRAELREGKLRQLIASDVFCALIQGAAAADNSVQIRPFAKAAVQAADILLEELGNG